MSHEFRALLRKVGSGPHTSQDLPRSEAESAMRLMLTQEATPAQIGAFLISHRIKRPTGTELAGMADAYDALGPQIPAISRRVWVFCYPYDGRSRTAPLGPLTALVMATAGIPVVQHGGDRVPTKEGLPLVELWTSLGIHWPGLTLMQVHEVLDSIGLGFVYLADHFPLAQALMPYRDQIGKRPPLSTLELMWSPYVGDQTVVCGYVHPPTEGMFRSAFELRGTNSFLTVKGLEGSCDLARDRTAIIGASENGEFERLSLAPRDYGFADREVPLMETEAWTAAALLALKGEPSELLEPLVWNSGFYLWRSQVSPTLEEGLVKARSILESGEVWKKLEALRSYFSKLH
jgi:anthranilate phosphoribosyltransferase